MNLKNCLILIPLFAMLLKILGEKMNREPVFLLLGSNLGNKRAYLANGILGLQLGGFSLQKASSIYASAPWGNPQQEWFENQCLMGSYAGTPEELLHLCLKVELSLDRERNAHWAPRTIDIDILLWGSLLHDFNNLQIPHPRLTERRFALMPLCELAADLVHPLTGISLMKHLEICEDALEVKKINL
jgi:2-amino-4-hydroxy-6-hydroxymethyldihydropteridine diphosphokinase